MYHTQEKRDRKLYKPICCYKNNAWLGHGYYFWGDEQDAHAWGKSSKRKTGRYEIYAGNIESDNFLDAVFDEKGYNFFVAQIEKAAKDFKNKTKKEPNVKAICSYIMKEAKWNTELDGVLFADNPEGKLTIADFPYRRRIQAVLYNLNSLNSFYFYKEEKC